MVISPKTKRNTLLGGFAGLVLTLGVVLLIEHPAIKGILESEEETEDTKDTTESSASTDHE